MTDDRFDKRFEELMRDAAQTYRRPPEAPYDEMWASIEAQLPGGSSRPVLEAAPPQTSSRPHFVVPSWYAIAATLVIGIGIGRATMLFNRSAESRPATTVAVATPAETNTAARADLSSTYDPETSRYLGQAAALLIALPAEMKGAKPADAQFITRASDLLTTTRMLMDSPAANDPSMRGLLDDLELVLAQVVRLQNNPDRTEMDLINHALEQRNVIPRLRTAAADISAN